MRIALLPGGFKPPHLGHYNMAKYLADFADKVIVRIGSKERDGIGKELSNEVWHFYKEFDPDPRAKKLVISVAQSPSPVKDVYDFVAKIAPEGSEILLGMGEKDAKDGRYNSIPKFAEPRNIKAEIKLVPPQAGGISGTRMREIIKANNKAEFFKYIPDYLPEEIKEEIWNKLTDATIPSNIEEMMGGTMNQQEMNRHLANMKKLRKFLSKQGDQMVQVPTKLTKGLRRKLYEGRYDQEGLIVSRFVINQFKENLGVKFEEDFEIGLLEDVEYNLELRFYPNETLGPPFYRVDGASDDSALNITINYDPSIFPKAYNSLIAEIKDTIRHELEHIGQFNFPKGTKYVKGDPKGFKYYSASYEIPAFVQGIYKKAKTQKVPFSQALEDFLEDREDELSPKELNTIKKLYTDYAKENLPAAQLDEGVKDLRPKMISIIQKHKISAQELKDQLKKGTKVEKEHTPNPTVAMKIALDHIEENPKYYDILSKVGLEEMKLFSKEWWLQVITEEILKEGGAGGHMAHPFDIPNVKTGKDLIKVFEQSAESLKKEPGAVKIDGVNASIRLINNDGNRQFAMDRGSKKELDIKGITKDDLLARFGDGHGMVKVGGVVLDIFDNALSALEPHLKKLGIWDNPNIMFNMEYVSGKSNVQDYGKNFLAIHGLLNVEMKEVEGKRGKMLTKRVISEHPYNQSDMDALLNALEPFAKKKNFEVYGSVPTTFTKDPDFKAALNKTYTISFTEGDKNKPLMQWLNDVTNIPRTDKLKMNVNGSVKEVGALSKQVYFAVFGGENIDDLFDSEQDIQTAIQGATTYLATEKLGDAILDVLDSPMGSVNDHEGVVIRDPKIYNQPFKITGKFITGGVSSDFQK